MEIKHSVFSVLALDRCG